MAELSITGVKAAFLRTQVRFLSAPLQPSTQWRDLAPEPADGRLSDKTIEDIVARIDEKIKQHNRLIYSARSQRHVAEQIEALYWNHVNAGEDRAEVDTVVVRRDADLTDPAAIEALAEEYTDLFVHPDHPLDRAQGDRFEELREQLLELSQRREKLKSRIVQYKDLRRLLEPFEDAPINIQPNLVTKDSELSRELERMRVLLARISGRVSEAGNRLVDIQSNNGDTRQRTNAQKLTELMELT